jgi:hypothetical protein
VRPVVVRPRVIADVLAAMLNSRALLGKVLFDLNVDLPRNLSHYQSNRLAKNPSCFWYTHTYSLDPRSFKLRKLRFVVRDSDPSMLEVIWVVVVA